MHPITKLVILTLAIGLAVSSYCAQVCGMPQLSASDCPQHHQPENTNCCDHSSVSSPGIRSADLVLLPAETAVTFTILRPEMEVRENYDPPGSAVPYSLRVSPSILRV